MQSGHRLRTQWCGGGGYGDPLERDMERVLWDVIEDKITPEHARANYGVVVDHKRQLVDAAATQRQRTRIRDSRRDVVRPPVNP